MLYPTPGPAEAAARAKSRLMVLSMVRYVTAETKVKAARMKRMSKETAMVRVKRIDLWRFFLSTSFLPSCV